MSASDVKEYMPVAERKVNVFGYPVVAGNLLATMHFVCSSVHFVMFALTLSAGYGKPMEVSIFRVKPSWTNTGRNGYGYDVVEAWELRIDVVTALFFGASAFFHFAWVILRVLGRFDYRIWKYFTSFIDDCFCPWRFVEYSLSASLMLVAIGLISGLRELSTMISIFWFSFTTMIAGILTELYSRPAEGYMKWQGDPDAPDLWARFTNYIYRMIPHYAGWIPYCTAWYLVLNNFYTQIWDLPSEIRERIPWFVPVAINGTVLTFSSFTFVQWRYQWIAPSNYWKTELWYGFLSVTAKLYLGLLLYWNVLLADSAEGAISPQFEVSSGNFASGSGI